MRDRTPTQVLANGALRYGVYDAEGNLLRYEYLALEDEPTAPGTELSKATLLQDSTEAALFGSAADRTVDDALAGIARQLKLIKDDMASITLTVQDTAGHPLPEVLVQGILSESGGAVYTNSSGVAAGYIGEGSQVIKVSGYADIADYSETLTVVKGTTITKTVKLTARDFLDVTSSGSYKFSGNVDTVDYQLLSGGGAGGAGASGWRSNDAAGGGGGAAGELKEVTGFTPAANTSYPLVVGAGGKAVADADGGDGGATSAFGSSIAGGKGGKCSLTSPQGGTGTTPGGKGAAFASSSTSSATSGNTGPTIWASFTGAEQAGGSGGGGGTIGYRNLDGGSGGTKNGGTGAKNASSTSINAGATPGAAGAGGYGEAENDDGWINRGGIGGNGYRGTIRLRMHLKSAA